MLQREPIIPDEQPEIAFSWRTDDGLSTYSLLHENKIEPFTHASHLALEKFLNEYEFPSFLEFKPTVEDKKKTGNLLMSKKGNDLIPNALKVLAEKLKTAKDPTTLILSDAFINQESANYIVSALAGAPKHFRLFVHDSIQIAQEGQTKTYLLNSLIRTFKSGQCKQWQEGFTLVSHVQTEFMMAIADAIEAGFISEGFNFFPYETNGNAHINHGYYRLVEALKSPKHTTNIGITFTELWFHKKKTHLLQKSVWSSVFELVDNNKIHYGLHLDFSQCYSGVGDFPFNSIPFLYSNCSVASLKFSYYTAIFDKKLFVSLKEVLKVNDTLTDVTFSFNPNLYPKVYSSNISLKVKSTIVDLLLQNTYTQHYKKLKINLSSPLNDFFNNDLSDIIISYLSGEPRKMHQEVVTALEQEDIFTAVHILYRNPALFDKDIRTDRTTKALLADFVKDFLTHKKTTGYNPKTVWYQRLKDSYEIFTVKDYSYNEESLCKDLETTLAKWKLSKTERSLQSKQLKSSTRLVGFFKTLFAQSIGDAKPAALKSKKPGK